LGRNSLSQPDPNPPSQTKPRRWSIIAAGLLLIALALVVIYTSRAAFSSPLALVVVAAIGLAALLLDRSLRKGQYAQARAPLWLNIVGLLLAVAAVFADQLRLSSSVIVVAALGAVLCFGISGTAILRGLRKR
jgi:FtsH-binding integral membrane protein